MRALGNAHLTEEFPGTALHTDRRIGTLLAAEGKLDHARIGQIIGLQQSRGLRFGEAALNLGFITPDDLLRALARQYDAPCPPPSVHEVHPELIVFRRGRQPRVEQLRTLRTQLLIRWSSLTSEPRALAVVSPGAREGRSFVAANLAVLFAQLGLRTLLVDADLRAPRQFRIFGIPDRLGLSSVLSGRAAGEVPLPAFGPLAVMPAGALPPNPQELLLRPVLASYLELAHQQYDMVLIDTPPAYDSADAHSVTFSAGSALVVARADYTRLEDTTALVRDLSDAGALVLGAVLNTF